MRLRLKYVAQCFILTFRQGFTPTTPSVGVYRILCCPIPAGHGSRALGKKGMLARGNVKNNRSANVDENMHNGIRFLESSFLAYDLWA